MNLFCFLGGKFWNPPKTTRYGFNISACVNKQMSYRVILSCVLYLSTYVMENGRTELYWRALFYWCWFVFSVCRVSNVWRNNVTTVPRCLSSVALFAHCNHSNRKLDDIWIQEYRSVEYVAYNHMWASMKRLILYAMLMLLDVDRCDN